MRTERSLTRLWRSGHLSASKKPGSGIFSFLVGIGPVSNGLSPSGPSGSRASNETSRLFDDIPPRSLSDRCSHRMVVDRGHVSL